MRLLAAIGALCAALACAAAARAGCGTDCLPPRLPPLWSADGTRIGFLTRGIGGLGFRAAEVTLSGRERYGASIEALDPRPALSPELSEIAYLKWQAGGQERVLAVQGVNETSERFDLPAAVGHARRDVAWSPDGKTLAFPARGGGLDALDVATRRARALFRGDYVDSVVWSDDGEQIAFTLLGRSGGRGLWVVNPDGTNLRQVSSALQPSSVVWSPDGTRIAFVDLSSDLRIFSLTGGESAPIAHGVYPTDWSPDGARILVTKPGSGIALLDPTTGLTKDLTNPAVGKTADEAVWSPDASLIAFSSLERCSVRGLYVMRADGSDVGRLTNDCTIRGTNRADRLVGGRFRDVIYGRGGNDRIFGRAANDSLYGGAGRDLVVGGNNSDEIWGGDGRDRIIGGGGSELIHARDGTRDAIFCGNGTDDHVIADAVDHVAADCEQVERG